MQIIKTKCATVESLVALNRMCKSLPNSESALVSPFWLLGNKTKT